MSNPKPTNPIKKGEVRNPTGRPKKGTSITEVLRKKMDDLVEINEGGKKVKRKYSELLARVIAENAVKGEDIKFIEYWIDRVEGKARQTIEANVEAKTALVEFIDGPKTKNGKSKNKDTD